MTTTVATIKTVGVIGAGTMGNGIAQVFAQAGFDVNLVDVSAPALDRARKTIEISLSKFVDKHTLTAADRVHQRPGQAERDGPGGHVEDDPATCQGPAAGVPVTSRGAGTSIGRSGICSSIVICS